jgi:GxxExxY protein
MEDEALTQKIIGCAMAVHRTLGPGFLESVYQKALAHELGKAGLIKRKSRCFHPKARQSTTARSQISNAGVSNPV